MDTPIHWTPLYTGQVWLEPAKTLLICMSTILYILDTPLSFILNTPLYSILDRESSNELTFLGISVKECSCF
ncbi:hypothetical protein C0J52_09699 [Blattella germanica]|nr:hypothetical protein C0J52_09699 [Blattella germanica]